MKGISPTTPSPKTITFRLIAASLGLFAGLIVLELAIRLLSLAPPIESSHGSYVSDPDLPNRRKPLSRITGRNSSDEFNYDYQHNSFGFRDSEHDPVKAKGTFRILGLGDSFTYGIGVTFEETYLYRLEAMLNRRAGSHPRIEIIKAGIPRYFPETERILLEKYGAQFQPDLVVVSFLPNDVVDTYLGLDAIVVDNRGYMQTREAKVLGRFAPDVYH